MMTMGVGKILSPDETSDTGAVKPVMIVAVTRVINWRRTISVGATILGAFMGRKAISATTIGKATTAIRGAGRAIKESQDVGQAQENREALQQQLSDLEAQFKAETDELIASIDPLSAKLEAVSLKPTKSNIAVKLVTLAWVPQWQDAEGRQTAAWQ